MYSQVLRETSLVGLDCDGGGWGLCHQVIYTDQDVFLKEILQLHSAFTERLLHGLS